MPRVPRMGFLSSSWKRRNENWHVPNENKNSNSSAIVTMTDSNNNHEVITTPAIIIITISHRRP